MKKSDLKLLRERNQKAVAPSPKKDDLSDELSKLFDDGTTLEKAPADDAPTPRPTSAHLTSDHLGSPQPISKRKKLPTAPERDFNRRANSIERDAIPAGLFPGASKKLYDALYLRTRGAHQPTRTIQATRTELMKWAGIGSRNTFLNHMRHFLKVGLLIRHFEIGDNDGAQYEVCIPEEIDLSHLGSPQPTSAHLTSAQELGGGSDQNVIRGEVGQTTENINTSDFPKTSFKTTTDDDETFTGFVMKLRAAAREVTGKDTSAAEGARWSELADVIVAELKTAAARTSVSSAPSFLSEHLRRRLAKPDAPPRRGEGKRPAVTEPAPLAPEEIEPPAPGDVEEFERARAELQGK